MILSCSFDGTAKLLDRQTGECLRTFLGHEAEVMFGTVSKDGSRVLTAGYDGAAKIWSSTTGDCIQTFKGSDDRLPGSTYECWQPKGAVGGLYSAVFSPDEGSVLTASAHGMVRLWRIESAICMWALRANYDEYTRSAVFSPDGTHVLTASADMTATVWSIESRNRIMTFTGHKGWLNTAVFSPDGKSVLTSSADYTAKLWSVNTGKSIGTFEGHTKYVRSAVFSPDGKRVLTCSSDWTAKVFDVQSFVCDFTLRGHEFWVNTAVFSPDSQQIVTSSRDHTIKLWCATSGVHQRTIGSTWNKDQANGMHCDFVMSAVFLPDMNLVIASKRGVDTEGADDIRTSCAKKARLELADLSLAE